MALQNFKHFKNNQHSCLCHRLFYLVTFYNVEKLTFNLQREVLNIAHTENFEIRELLLEIIQTKIYFKHLYYRLS